MINEIKSIRKKELEALIEKTEQEILDIQTNQLEGLLKERSRLTSPDIVRNFSWFQKNISQRKDYKEYIKTAVSNKAKLPILEEDIVFCENKIADAKQKIGNTNRKIIRFQTINTLGELEIDNFQEAVNLLKTHEKDLILENGDIINPLIAANFRDISNFCFIYKASTLPKTSQILSEYDLKENTKIEVLMGETLTSILVPSWKKTVHGTINCIDYDEQSKYAILSPFKNIDKSTLVSALPSNNFFDSSIPIPESSYILIPKSELNEVSNELKDNENITVIGYNDDFEQEDMSLTLNDAISALMNNLNYSEQEYTKAGWENIKNFHDFQSIVEEILTNECKIDLEDVVENSDTFPFELNRFLPYGTTKYLIENSKIKKESLFAKSVEYLHENIKEFDVIEKELKTRTIVEYDTEVLKSDPKDKSLEKVDDVFSDFIEILKSRDSNAIDEYLTIIDNRYIPDKEAFRDELLKSTSRLKNDGPIRNAFFSNLFQRFLHLEISQEQEQEEIEIEDKVETPIETKPVIPEVIEKIIKQEKPKPKRKYNKEIIILPKEEEKGKGKETKIVESNETQENNTKNTKEKDSIIKYLEEINDDDYDKDEIIIEPLER